MKKTLAAVAILGAFAGSAVADVTLYGNLDTALHYTHEASVGDSVSMDSSGSETSLIGFKGSEKISEDLTVGFKLEAAFDADTGAGGDNTLFRRESLFYVQTAFGELGFGRTGGLGASTGSYAFFGSGNTGFGGGYKGVGDNGFVFLGKASRLDNSITYKSPSMAGVTIYAQVGSDSYTERKEGGEVITHAGEYSHDQNRYYAIGARYAAGAFNAGLVVSQTDYSNDLVMRNMDDADDSLEVTGFANYDFGPAKVLMAAQYFDGSKATYTFEDDDKDVTEAGTAGYEGYGVTLAVSAPVLGGTAKGIVGYADAEKTNFAGITSDEKRMMVGAYYEYKLSARTAIYTTAGYNYTEVDAANPTKDDVKETIHGLVGLYHKF